jgi:hypothetical protein
MASGQLLTVYKKCWNGLPLQSTHNQALLHQELLVHWRTSCMMHAIIPAASMVFHSSSRMLHQWVQTMPFRWPHKQRSAVETSGDLRGPQLFHFVLFINMGSGSLNTTGHHEKNGQGPLHAVPTFSATLSMVCHPVVAVTVQIKTVNKRPREPRQ